jgi:Mrp family chromosome partitioning ATPase
MSQNFELLSQLEAELSFGMAAPRVIPRTEKTAEDLLSASANQALLNLAQTVFLSGNGSAPHAVVLCGVDQQSGSSAICAQLGRILANYSAKPICLIDADVRNSRLSLLLDNGPDKSISILAGEELEQVEKDLWLTSIDAMSSTCGDPLGMPIQLRQRLEKLRQSFDFILIDAPGVNSRTDAAVLSQIVDGAILVVEANSTRKAAALKAKKAMEAMKVRLIGTVLNNRTFPIPEVLYSRL